MSSNEQYQVRLVTKEKQFAIAQQVFDIKSTFSVIEFNSLVNQLLTTDNDAHETQSFVFLANGYMLKDNLSESLEAIEKKGDSVIEIEYFVQTKPPIPFNSLLVNDWVSSVHANDKYVLSGSYNATVDVWSIQDGSHVLNVKAHSSSIKAVRWVPIDFSQKDAFNLSTNDYLFLTASFDETCILWKWTEHSKSVVKLHVFKGHIRSVDCLDVYSNVFVSGSYDKMIKLWTLTASTDNKNVLEQAPAEEEDDEGAVSSNKRARHHEPIVQSPYITLGGHAEAISDVCWMHQETSSKFVSSLPDLASCSIDHTIRIWDMEAFEEKATLRGSNAFMSLDWSPAAGLLVTGSCDSYVRLFDPRASEGSIVRAGYSSHKGWVASVAWKPDSIGRTFVSGSFDRHVKQWDVRSTKAPLFDLLGHDEKVLCVDWANPSYIVSGSTDRHVKIYRSL